MDRLEEKEVLHVANLAKLELSDSEVEKFSYQLKSILNEIDKINNISVKSEGILISPNNGECSLRDDIAIESNSDLCNDILNNAPLKFDSFVEVRGVFND